MRVIPIVALAAVAACKTTVDPAPQVAMREGRPIYETTCTVGLAAVGNKQLWGPYRGQTATDYYSCQPQADATCPSGYDLVSKTKGLPQSRVDTINTGAMIRRVTSYSQEVTIRYQCTA